MVVAGVEGHRRSISIILAADFKTFPWCFFAPFLYSFATTMGDSVPACEPTPYVKGVRGGGGKTEKNGQSFTSATGCCLVKREEDLPMECHGLI